MSRGEAYRLNLPDRTSIALSLARTVFPLSYGLVVIVVLLRLGKKKEVLMCLSGPILDALGVGIGLVPNDVRAQIPALLLKCEG